MLIVCVVTLPNIAAAALASLPSPKFRRTDATGLPDDTSMRMLVALGNCACSDALRPGTSSVSIVSLEKVKTVSTT